MSPRSFLLNGHRLFLSITLSPVKDAHGRVIGVSTIARDISERKHVEAAMAQMAAIVESSDDAIVSKDLNGIIASWNMDVAEVIEKAEEVVRPAAEAKGISLEVHLDRNVGQITGDPDRLQQVVWNLLSNAIKFTNEGGRVEISLERIDQYVQIAVRDTGRGIKQEFLPYVFDRYRQAETSSGRRASGLGLGLSLARQLVEMHSGKITAESEGEGKGATFTVILPVRAVYTTEP